MFFGFVTILKRLPQNGKVSSYMCLAWNTHAHWKKAAPRKYANFNWFLPWTSDACV